MEIVGKIKVLGLEEQVGASFKKRVIVITTDEQYPQHISIEFQQDRADLPHPYSVGEQVKVSINLRGREWTSPLGDTKYFNSIIGWKIERLGTAIAPAQVPTVSDSGVPDDDMPF